MKTTIGEWAISGGVFAGSWLVSQIPAIPEEYKSLFRDYPLAMCMMVMFLLHLRDKRESEKRKDEVFGEAIHRMSKEISKLVNALTLIHGVEMQSKIDSPPDGFMFGKASEK